MGIPYFVVVINLKTKHSKQFFEEVKFADELHSDLATKKGYL